MQAQGPISRLILLLALVLTISIPEALFASSHTSRTPTYGPYVGTATAAQLAAAMDVPASSIISASLGTSDPVGAFVFTSTLAGFPTNGGSFAAISSGHAANALLPNNSGSLSTVLGGLNNSQGRDLVRLTLTLNVPVGATHWAVDWKFLSEEFPEFVGSAFNDAFLIETPTSNFIISGFTVTAPNNVAFDASGELVSINTTGFFGMTALNAQGTTYDGATATLTTSAPLPTGATQVTIIFSVMDLGDSIFDTTVFLDDFRFTSQAITPSPALITRVHRSSPSSLHTVRGGADPVDLGTGSYVLQPPDAAISTRGLPLEFTRTYHSAVAGTEGALGFGWTHNYEMSVLPDFTGALIVRMADGRLDRYVNDGSGIFKPPPGIFNQLVINTDGTFTLTTKERDSYIFDPSGRLLRIRDRNGNTTTLNYTGSPLTSVAAPDGRLLTFNYDATGRLIRVTDPLNRQTTYGYDTAGNLTSVTDPLGGVRRFTYDAEHRMISLSDPRGNTILTNRYDAEGRVIEQVDTAGGVTTLAYLPGETVETDPLGRVRRYQFNAALRITAAIDPQGGVLGYSYDANGNLASFTDELGNITRFTWDARGNVTTILDPLANTGAFTYDIADNMLNATDPRGSTTAFGYDTVGNLTAIADALGGTTALGYESLGQLTSATDAKGNKATFAYDEQGNASSIADPQGNPTTLAHDAAGRLTQVTDPLGHAASFSYDALDRPLIVRDALANTSSYAYDANDNLTSATDAKGVSTAYTYDAFNRLAKVVDGLGGTVNYNYDAVGNLVSLTDPNGHSYQYSYDGRDLLSDAIDPSGNTTQLDYDAAKRLVEITDPLGNGVAYTYDALGRLVAVADALGHITRFGFDANSNLVSTTDANGILTSFAYDALNRLGRVTDALGGMVDYTYDAVGNRTALMDQKDHVTRYIYDTRNQLTQVIDPLGRITRYSYDADGRLISRTDAGNHVTQYLYDAADQLTRISYDDGTSVQYTYDKLGNALSMTDSTGATVFTYDNLSRLVSVTDPAGRQIRYGYDPADNRVSMTYPDGKIVTYSYDANDRLSSVTDWLGNVTRYIYDFAGRLVETRHANGVRVINTLDAADRLVAITNMRSSDLKILANTTYELDAVGNRLSVTTEPASNATRPTRSTVINYTYDVADQLVTAGGIPLTFDANGNQITCGQDTFDYDRENRLTRTEPGLGQSCRGLATALGLSPAGGTPTTHAYNGAGLRVIQGVGGSTMAYIWDFATGLPVVVADSNNRYVYGLDLISAVDPQNRVSTYVYDGLGSVVAVADGNSNVGGPLAYDAFGTQISSGTTPGTFSFAGQQTDETRLIYLRARYYDPLTGRFITVDDFAGIDQIPQTINRYVYVLNNPTGFTDPNGNILPIVGAVVAKAAAGAVFGFATNYSTQVFSNLNSGKSLTKSLTDPFKAGRGELIGSTIGGAVGGGLLGGFNTFTKVPAAIFAKLGTLSPSIAGAAGGTVKSVIQHGITEKRLPAPGELISDIATGALLRSTGNYLSGSLPGVGGNTAKKLAPFLFGQRAIRNAWEPAAIGGMLGTAVGIAKSFIDQTVNEALGGSTPTAPTGNLRIKVHQPFEASNLSPVNGRSQNDTSRFSLSPSFQLSQTVSNLTSRASRVSIIGK